MALAAADRCCSTLFRIPSALSRRLRGISLDTIIRKYDRARWSCRLVSPLQDASPVNCGGTPLHRRSVAYKQSLATKLMRWTVRTIRPNIGQTFTMDFKVQSGEYRCAGAAMRTILLVVRVSRSRQLRRTAALERARWCCPRARISGEKAPSATSKYLAGATDARIRGLSSAAEHVAAPRRAYGRVGGDPAVPPTARRFGTRKSRRHGRKVGRSWEGERRPAGTARKDAELGAMPLSWPGQRARDVTAASSIRGR